MNLSERDLRVIWHPYTQMKNGKLPISIVKGEGSYLYAENGTRYIDGISSWWVNTHGHSHPYIAKKVYKQFNELEHVIFAGFTHPKAVELAERLLMYLPNNQTKIFYSDNGSTAVEVAVKMSLQFWHNKDINKNKVIAFNNSYHGDTFGAMSVSNRSIFTQAFNPFLFDVIFIDVPTKGHEDKSFNQLKKILETNEVASFIFEPLIQGAGGMIMYESQKLDQLIKYCKKKHVITIADEVMTGFGRTGKFFATDYLNEKPDIYCLSKGLTGGVMAMGVTSCSQHIYDAFMSNDKSKTFFHGHSYTANPLACTAALASLDLFDKPQCFENIHRIEQKHKDFSNRIKSNQNITNLRQKGTILAFDIKTAEDTSYLNRISDKIYDFFLSKHIILRPLGNVIYIMPPYCINDDDLDYIYISIEEFLGKYNQFE